MDKIFKMLGHVWIPPLTGSEVRTATSGDVPTSGEAGGSTQPSGERATVAGGDAMEVDKDGPAAPASGAALSPDPAKPSYGPPLPP